MALPVEVAVESYSDAQSYLVDENLKGGLCYLETEAAGKTVAFRMGY